MEGQVSVLATHLKIAHSPLFTGLEASFGHRHWGVVAKALCAAWAKSLGSIPATATDFLMGAKKQKRPCVDT